MNSAKLYVGNLSYETSEASIRTLFEPHGQVNSVNLITDRDTGRAKGFGFVEMSTPEEAQKAVAELDGTQLDGRALKVNEAKPQVPRESRSGGRHTAVAAATAAAVVAVATAAAAAPAGKSRVTRALMKRRPSGRRFCLWTHAVERPRSAVAPPFRAPRYLPLLLKCW